MADFWDSWNTWVNNFLGFNSYGPSVPVQGSAGVDYDPTGPVQDAHDAIFDNLDTSIVGDDSSLGQDLEAGVSTNNNPIASFVSEHPGASGEELLKGLSISGDEWAEKWIDYLVEKQSIADANAYTANREDTAYQRLVQDLRMAGLNPALMYGSSASPHAAGSAGVVNMTSGANSRSISNYEKVKKLLLSYMLYEYQKNIGEAKFASQFGMSVVSVLLSMFN